MTLDYMSELIISKKNEVYHILNTNYLINLLLMLREQSICPNIEINGGMEK